MLGRVNRWEDMGGTTGKVYKYEYDTRNVPFLACLFLCFFFAFHLIK